MKIYKITAISVIVIGIVATALRGRVPMPELLGADLVFLILLLLTVATLFLYARDVT